MKKRAIFEYCVGATGLLMWVIYVLFHVHVFWVVLPSVLAGVCVIPQFFKHETLTVPEGFKSAFKKNNIITFIISLVIAAIAFFAIEPSGKVDGWDLWVYFVAYAFVFCHGSGLLVAYRDFIKKK